MSETRSGRNHEKQWKTRTTDIEITFLFDFFAICFIAFRRKLLASNLNIADTICYIKYVTQQFLKYILSMIS